MALNTVLLLAAGMGMSAGFQDPTFNMQFAIPVIDQNSQPTSKLIDPAPQSGGAFQPAQAVQPPAYVTTQARAPEATQGKKVSAQFKNAKVSEVLDWMQAQGISFVIAEGMVPSDARVTLNIVDQPAENVIDALGGALGGHWAREKSIRVFRQGPGPLMFLPTPGRAPLRGFAGAEGANAFDEKAFAQGFGPDFQKKMELMGKDMAAKYGPEHEMEMLKHFGPDFQKKMELSAKGHELMAKELQLDMQKRFGPEFQKKMEAEAKVMSKRSVDIARQHKLSEKDHKVFIERARAAGAVEVRDGYVYRTKDGKTEKLEIVKDGVTRFKDGTTVRSLSTGKNRSISVERSERGRTPLARGGQIDAKKFLSTLTAEQKHSMRMRGFVYYVDLTREQRELLGAKPDGKFEIKLKIDEQEVVVKGG